MFGTSKMMETNYLMEKALDVESLRKTVITNNITNVDVPHFKRSEVNFESELRRTIENNKFKAQNEVPAILTDRRHIAFTEYKNITSVQPRINLDYSTSYNNNGNNVDIEKEMVDASKNLMRYSAIANGLSQNFKLLKSIMRVG
ncbi:MAG: flagellar basal body rod protein FlgB [Spirochaetes bacterium]|nr:flagellar basal body rod protein FlgB [Spirochaetota bacterium]